MGEEQVTDELWERIDGHLARSEVFSAFLIYREATGCGVADAKDTIGTRFRERFPELWKNYRNVSDDD